MLEEEEKISNWHNLIYPKFKSKNKREEDESFFEDIEREQKEVEERKGRKKGVREKP